MIGVSLPVLAGVMPFVGCLRDMVPRWPYIELPF